MSKTMIMLAAACVAGAAYFINPAFMKKYFDTVLVGFAGMAYIFFVRPWLKSKILPKEDKS